jgi:hypothetical protein
LWARFLMHHEHSWEAFAQKIPHELMGYWPFGGCGWLTPRPPSRLSCCTCSRESLDSVAKSVAQTHASFVR